MIDIYLDEEMEAPCPCDKCGEWFDLHTGRSLLGSNVIICRECYDTITNEPKGKERKDLRRDDIVWSENLTARGDGYASTHAYYQNTNEIAVALCNGNHVGDGDWLADIHTLDNNSEYKYACRRCQKMFDKLSY